MTPRLTSGGHLFDNNYFFIIMKRFALLLIGLLALPVCAGAFDHEQNATLKHEVRIGWGGAGYERAVFYNSYTRQNYRYSGHIFGEYQYHFNHWLSAGLQLDWEKVSWNSNQYFTNFSILPDVRFTYFKRPWVNMYSGIGIGMCINSGTEIDSRGRKTVCSPATNLTLFGISVTHPKGFFGSFEIGGIDAAVSKNEIYMAASRILSISFGYRF